jgi:AraC-like DNA-binding protein
MHHYDLENFSRKGEKIFINKSVYIEGFLPMHNHNFIEMFFIMEGRGIHIINGERKPLNKGDLIFLSFHSFHTIQPLTDDFYWINLTFYPEFLDKKLINHNNANEFLKLSIFNNLFEGTNMSGDIVITDAESEFRNLFTELLKEYTEHERGYLDNIKNLLIIVLMRIFRKKFNEPSAVKIKNLNDGDYLIQLIMEVLNSKINEHISLNDIAQRAYTNPKYFSRLFKDTLGISFKDFVNKTRIEKACELLTQTDYAITKIANFVGYSDSKFFYHIFKRQTGLTPGEYREKQQSDIK